MMIAILTLSIAILLVATGWSIVLLRRSKDWRTGFLTVMFGLMTLRQILTLLTENESWASSITSHATEISGLVVGITAFLAIFFLDRITRECVGAKEALQQSQRNLTIRNEIGMLFLINAGEEVFAEILRVILEATESVCGVFGYVDENGALVCPAMTGEVWGKCQVAGKDIVFPRDTWDDSLWCHALRDQKSLYCNRTSRVPEERIPISRNLAVPITHEQEAIGLIYVADKRTDYDAKDVAMLEDIVRYTLSPTLHARITADRQEKKRRRAEQALREAQDKLQRAAELADAKERAEAADRLKSAFLAAMSHELRTPLNSIIGFTGIILQGLPGPLNDEQAKQLRMVQGSARHLLDLITDVLDISKIEAGQLEIVARPFDMREAIEKAVQTVTPLAHKKGLTLVADVASQVGQVTSDRRRVEQVLINLMSNAVKFTDTGRVSVACRVSDGLLVTRVADTGIGIRSEDRHKLFEPFRQLDAGLSRQRGGTGLGLSICKKLADMLSGEISVESEFGVGSTFTFTLPMKEGG